MPTIQEIQGAVLVMHGDTVVVETVSPGFTPRTRFQIASVSKQFTAAAVLLLAQRGLLSLDDPIGRWVGGPPSWQGITLHHLLSHTSGLGHWDDYPMIDLHRRVDPQLLLETFHEIPPRFAPGDCWHYSSPAYVLLAHVVEHVADAPYREVLAREIFTPLGLADTFVGEPGDRPDLAVGHGVEGEPVPSYELDVVARGAGDLWSTPADLVRWIDGLRAGRLLDEEHLELMLFPHAATDAGADTSGLGYGWMLGTVGDRPWFHHSGANAGFRSFDACLPESDHRIVILSNTEATGAVAVNELLQAVLV